MATINLGSIKFNWKGTYGGGTPYVVDDVVSYNGSSYICKLASTGNLPTNTTYWDQMSSAGTNGTDGTDLTTTLTTQGDIVYRDASGLARLPAGSANQVLQSGGTGANPSWGTVSSDYVLLSTTNISSGASAYSTDIFSSTYPVYKVFIDDLSPASATSSRIEFLFRASNANLTTNDYITLYHKSYHTFASGDSDGIVGNSWNIDHAKIIDDLLNYGSYGTSIELTIYNTQNTTSFPQVEWKALAHTDNNQLAFYDGYSQYRVTTSVNSGFSINFENNTFAKGNVKVYGLK